MAEDSYLSLTPQERLELLDEAARQRGLAPAIRVGPRSITNVPFLMAKCSTAGTDPGEIVVQKYRIHYLVT